MSGLCTPVPVFMHACSLYILNEVILQSLSQSCPLPTFCTLVHAPLYDVQNTVLNIVYAVYTCTHTSFDLQSKLPSLRY